MNKITLADVIKMTPEELEALTGFSAQDVENIKASIEAANEFARKCPDLEIIKE